MSSYPKPGYRPNGRGRGPKPDSFPRRPLQPYRPLRPPEPKLPTKFNPRKLNLPFVTKKALKALPAYKVASFIVDGVILGSALYAGYKGMQIINPGGWTYYPGCPVAPQFISGVTYTNGCLINQAVTADNSNPVRAGFWTSVGSINQRFTHSYSLIRPIPYTPLNAPRPVWSPMVLPGFNPANPFPFPEWLPGLIPGLIPPNIPQIPSPRPVPYPLIPHLPKPVYPTDPVRENKPPENPWRPTDPETETPPTPWVPAKPPVEEPGTPPTPWPEPPIIPKPGDPPVVRPKPNPNPNPKPNPKPNPGTNPPVTPKPNPKPEPERPRPPSPPGKGEKEKKVQQGLNPKAWLGWFMNAQGEFNDLVSALYDALPRHLRHYGRDRGPYAKLRTLYRHLGEMEMKRAIANVMANEIEDTVFGKLGQAGQHFGDASDLTHGIGHGGSERQGPRPDGLPRGKDLADYIYDWLPD